MERQDLMDRITIPILMNGVTGRMGSIQHLERSIAAIRAEGGVQLGQGRTIWPEPILAGRNEAKLKELAGRFGIDRWTTDLDAAIKDPEIQVYFDAQTTQRRASAVRKAMEAGKHIYAEKPLSEDTATALELAKLARQKKLCNGIVQDKLFLPGLLKLKRLIDSGYFGRILSVKGDFGYWVFEGDWHPAQRPSWNYRKEDGGGIVVDMMPHWQYVLENLFGTVNSVYCHAATHIPQRVDEAGKTYECTADDAAYAVFDLAGGIVAQINASWTTRVHRDELVIFQVDGTHGSAVAGLWGCHSQHRTNTPKPVWNPDSPDTHDYRADWAVVPGNRPFDNAFKTQWELFLRHVALGEAFPWDFFAAAKGIQLAELSLQSTAERRAIDVSPLALDV